MISSEAEAVGKFVGDCISTPIVQAGTLLSVLGYMLYTEPRLGLVVLFIAVPQLFLVPMIQRRINVYVRERAHSWCAPVTWSSTPRCAAEHPLVLLEARSAEHSKQSIARLRAFKLKFGLKFLLSALQSVAVFVLLFVGGIMVLKGKTEIGIVVAFISGLDRVLEPWRELIAFVRSTSAAKVQFDLLEGTLGGKLGRRPHELAPTGLPQPLSASSCTLAHCFLHLTPSEKARCCKSKRRAEQR